MVPQSTDLLRDHVVGVAAGDLVIEITAWSIGSVSRATSGCSAWISSGRHDRVAAQMRHGGVAAGAGQLDRSNSSEAAMAGPRTWRRCRSAPRPVVQAEHLLGREALEQAVVDHHPAAATALLGRLEDQVDGAVEVAGLGQVAGGTQQHGGVPVMAAGVHPAGPARPMRESVGLLDRQGIHIGAQADRGAAAPAHDHRHHAGAADAGVDLVEAEGAQLLGHERRGLALLEAELRPLVQVAPPRRSARPDTRRCG